MDWPDYFDRTDGVARRRDLLAAGLSPRRLHTALRHERWQQALPGVVVRHGGPLSQRQYWRAALAYAGADSVLSHHSAGFLHGMRIEERRVHVTVPHGQHRRSVGFVVVHQSSRPDHDWVGGLPCTSAARAAVDTALTMRASADIAALLSHAVQERLVTLDQLVAELRAAPSRGRRRPAEVLVSVQAGSRSAGEVRFRRLILRAGLPEPEWNVAVVTPSGRFVVDALWRSAGLVVEIDGARWHLDAASWQRDLRRANALQASGLRMLRFSVSQLLREPDAVVAAVRGVLTAAA